MKIGKKRSNFFCFVNIEEEAMGPNVKVLGDSAKFARQPERYARKWRKLAQVSS